MKIGAIIIDSGCDNNCLFCPGRPPATYYEIIQQEKVILENIEFFMLKKYDMIEISGNDPATYKDIYGLINYLKKRFKRVRLSTHGKNLNTELLAKAGLDEIKIPIYGPNARIHELVARAPNSFNKAIKTIKEVISTDIKLIITSLIFKQNINFLEELYDFVSNYTPRFTLGMPFILDYESSKEFYVPYKQLINRINDLIKYTNYKIRLVDIPYCIIGSDYKYAFFSNPPELGLQQPPKELQTNIRNVPSYRLKIKLEFCSICKYNNKCDGFLKNDIVYYGLARDDINSRPMRYRK